MTARSSPLSSQIIATGGGEAANRVAQLLSMALAGWVLGVEGLGIIGLAWSVVSIIQAVVLGGPELAGIRALALAGGDERRQSAIVVEILRLKLLMALAAIPVIFAAAWAMEPQDPRTWPQVGAQTCAMIAASLGSVWALRGLGRSLDQGLIRSGQAAGTLLLLWGVLQVWRSPLAVPLAEAVAALAAAGIGWTRLRHAPRGQTARHHFTAAALKLGFTSVLGTLAWWIPILVVARLGSMADVGILTGLLRLILGINGLMHIGFQAVLPALSHLFATAPHSGRAAIAAITAQSTVLTVAALAVLAVIAEWALPLLLGPAFAPAVPLFLALLPLLLATALSAPAIYALMANGQHGELLVLQMGATIACAVACVLAVRWEAGVWSALALQLVMWLQGAALLLSAHRHRLIGRAGAGWRALLDPRHLDRMIKGGEP